jgi:hypothetical protein
MVDTSLGLDQHLKAHQKAEDFFAAIGVNDAFVNDHGTAPRQRRLNLPNQRLSCQARTRARAPHED